MMMMMTTKSWMRVQTGEMTKSGLHLCSSLHPVALRVVGKGKTTKREQERQPLLFAVEEALAVEVEVRLQLRPVSIEGQPQRP